MGGWKGSGEERDNKAGGDVNSQIGSFSCFPQPATLDGWLRQRPERIGETRAPPESWGNGGEGGSWSLAGVCGDGAPRGWGGGGGKGMAPGTGQLLGNPEGDRTNCLQASPVCNPWAGEDSTGSRRLRVCVPSGIQGGTRGFHSWGQGWGKGRRWLPIVPLSVLCFSLCSSSPPPPIFPPFSLSLLPLFLSSIFPSSLGDISWL